VPKFTIATDETAGIARGVESSRNAQAKRESAARNSIRLASFVRQLTRVGGLIANSSHCASARAWPRFHVDASPHRHGDDRHTGTVMSRDGFAVLPRLVVRAELHELRAQVDRVLAHPLPPGCRRPHKTVAPLRWDSPLVTAIRSPAPAELERRR